MGDDVFEEYSESCPYELQHVWDTFNDLNSARGANGFVPGRISYADILAYATLNQYQPSPTEVQLLIKLDLIWWEVFSERSGRTNAKDKERAGADSDNQA